MKKIAIYGKGGSGKSTISAALSVVFAKTGRKVLLVGCDPKGDSTLHLTGGRRIVTLLDLLAKGRARPEPEEFIVTGRHGIDCVEAGGPVPGAGCGGRGVARMFELFKEIRLLERRQYDIVLFDVLGDVVCGGFAAPLRMGFADRAFIVVSEEPLSLYAANNIVHATASYAENGVRLGGLILNVSDDIGSAFRVHDFAARLGTRVIGTIPRDRAIHQAEQQHLTAAELDPNSETVARFRMLAEAILSSFEYDPGVPVALPLERLFGTSPSSEPGPGSCGDSISDRGDLGKQTGWRIDHPRSPMASACQAGDENGNDQSHVSGQTEPLLGSPTAIRIPRNPPASLSGCVRGGAVTRKKAFELLGLAEGRISDLAIEVTAVEWERGVISISLHSPALRRLVLTLAPSSDSGPAYAVAGDCKVTHSQPLSKLRKKVLDYSVERLRRAGTPFSFLLETFAVDPESVFEGTQEERKDHIRHKVQLTPRHWTLWGAEGTRGVFFFSQERARLILLGVQLGDSAISVHHATEVCEASELTASSYWSHFVRFPWGDTDHEALIEPVGLAHYPTNIQEHELIAGSNQALKAALDDIARSGRSDPVIINVTCTPVIAGEDWRSLASHFKARYPGPVLVSAVSGTDLSAEIARAGWDAVASRIPSTSSETIALANQHAAQNDIDRTVDQSRSTDSVLTEGSVNLVGFPPAVFTLELAALLEMAGIRVHDRQLPVVSLQRMKRFAEARAQVLWPQAEYSLLYRDLFEKLPVPVVKAPPPFGLKGTERFIEAVAVGAGVDPKQALRLVAPVLDQCREELEALRSKAARHRLGVAVTSRQTGLLDRPELLCGVPVVDFLEDLGFRVEVLVGSEDEGRLRWWLHSGLSAVCSDLTYDHRLLDAGVAWFSLADLEAGPQGAVRTMRRLLRLVSTPFFRNYLAFGAGER